MNFKEFVIQRKSNTYNKLNDFQLRVLDIVNNLDKPELIRHLFVGKKACPYRIIQHLWTEFLSYYPKHYSSKEDS